MLVEKEVRAQLEASAERVRTAGVPVEVKTCHGFIRESLRQLINDTKADLAIRDLARIRAGYALADTLKPDELKTRLAGLDSAGNPWRHQVREIIGIAAWRTGDFALAGQTMSEILADVETPAGMRQRAQIISQLLEPLLPKK
jgi:hypothetical protein